MTKTLDTLIHDELTRVSLAKQTMPLGPWTHEPDRKYFVTPEGYPALIRRVDHGALCGYVAVPRTHPLYNHGYEDADTVLDVHGGVTYASTCSNTICHVPNDESEDDVWWFGFDCGHAGDLIPRIKSISQLYLSDPDIGSQRRGTYKTLEYVESQILHLSTQLKALEQSP